MWWDSAWSSPELKTRELIHAVKRRSLVAFGQRRIVENRVDEIVDFAFENQHGLPDVQQLGRAFANDVHAQDLAGFTMEDELEASGGVATNLPTRDFAIVRHADFVGNVLSGKLFFGLADERDFGDGVNP